MQTCAEVFKKCLDARLLDLSQRHRIDPGCASVPLHAFPCFPTTPVDAVHQRMIGHSDRRATNGSIFVARRAGT